MDLDIGTWRAGDCNPGGADCWKVSWLW